MVMGQPAELAVVALEAADPDEVPARVDVRGVGLLVRMVGETVRGDVASLRDLADKRDGVLRRRLPEKDSGMWGVAVDRLVAPLEGFAVPLCALRVPCR